MRHWLRASAAGYHIADLDRQLQQERALRQGAALMARLNQTVPVQAASMAPPADAAPALMPAGQAGGQATLPAASPAWAMHSNPLCGEGRDPTSPLPHAFAKLAFGDKENSG